MDDEVDITNGLYECFNLMRTTVEGIIPYNNDGNIWNIPGSLKRVKKASFKILTFGLRNNKALPGQEKHEDLLKVSIFNFFVLKSKFFQLQSTVFKMVMHVKFIIHTLPVLAAHVQSSKNNRFCRYYVIFGRNDRSALVGKIPVFMRKY